LLDSLLQEHIPQIPSVYSHINKNTEIMVGRGAKFQKYYENKMESMSITRSIETTLGTGHRLANHTVVPSLSCKKREIEVADRVGVSLSNMWEELERDRRSNSVASQEAPISPGDVGETTKIVPRTSEAEEQINEYHAVVQEHEEYGCDESQENESDDIKIGCIVPGEKNDDTTRLMLGVKKEQQSCEGRRSKGRGRPRYRGNLEH